MPDASHRIPISLSFPFATLLHPWQGHAGYQTIPLSFCFVSPQVLPVVTTYMPTSLFWYPPNPSLIIYRGRSCCSSLAKLAQYSSNFLGFATIGCVKVISFILWLVTLSIFQDWKFWIKDLMNPNSKICDQK
jgi:hypothetical protein